MILAIDDDPGRYDHLRRLLEARDVELFVVACPACVSERVRYASGVLLDYDLDSGEPCAGCWSSYGVWSHAAKGLHHVPALAARRVPVVVTSASYHENVSRLCAALREADVVWHDIVELSGRPRASEVTEIIELNLNLNEMETTVASFPLDGREDDFISGSDGEYSHTLYEAVLV